MNYKDIIPSPEDLGNGFKFAVGGAVLGAAAAGVSSAFGDLLIKYAGLDEGDSTGAVAGRTVVRAAIAVPFFLMADRLLKGMGPMASDPTEGVFFTAAFILPQVTSLLPLAARVRESTKSAIGVDCCGSCASGGTCESKK